MEIIKCKFCEKLFYRDCINSTTASNVIYDYEVCKKCNKKAKENADEN